MSASCTISLDWNSADALIYGDCWIEVCRPLDLDDQGGPILYDIARRDAEQYAARVGAVLLEGPPRYVDCRNYIWPVAVTR